MNHTLPPSAAPRISRRAGHHPRGHRSGIRERVLDAARDELQEHGCDAVGMRAVARRADIPGTSIYRHFADRSDLLDALAEAAYAGLTAAMRQALESAPLATPEDRFRLIARALEGWARPHFAQFALLYSPVPVNADPWPVAVLASRSAATQVVVRVVADVIAAQPRGSAPGVVVDHGGPTAIRDADGTALGPEVLDATMSAWSALIGHIALTPRRSDVVADPERHYAHHVERVLLMLTDPGPQGQTATAHTTTLPR